MQKQYINSSHFTPTIIPITINEKGCWLWGGGTLPKGYGRCGCPHRKKSVVAHKVIWESINGRVPPGHEIHHRCESKGCVNPDHLEMLTIQKHRSMPRVRRGDKLTIEDARAIRSSKESGSVLGKRYGISRQTVFEIKRGNMWKHA